MKKKQQISNSREELISMILGLGVVILVVVVIINFVVRNKGNISVPGISVNEQKIALTTPGLNNTNVNVYEVKKGDSLWSIAVDKYKDGYAWTKIASENKLKNASVIEIGQKLVLPNLATVTLEKTESVNKITTSTADTYTVLKNDSLWKIAVSQLGDGYKWTQILNLNKNIIANANKLEVGMILRLR